MYKDYDIKFGKNLRALRMAHKLTQDELASKLQAIDVDLTRHDIDEIEYGKRPIYPRELKALRKVMKVSYEELMP